MFVWRQFGIAFAGFAIGALVALLVRHNSDQGTDGQRWNPVARVSIADAQHSQVGAARQAISASSVDQVGQDAASARQRSVHQDKETRTPTYEDNLRNARKQVDALRAKAEVSETNRLLAAGYYQEQIDALRHRKEELWKQRRQSIDDPAALSLVFDRDLVLRDEMSDAEYIRYRQALRQPTSVGVEQVHSGSNAATAGILPGDQVVKYDGRRVFDVFELDALARSRTSNEPAVVELLRGGQVIEVRLPTGPTGIGMPRIPPSSARILNFLEVD